jgi:hypothetical protein
MNKHLWPLKLLVVLARNRLWLKPHAWRARRLVKRLLHEAGYSPRSIDLNMGLGEASDLRVTVIFRTDDVLREFNLTPLKKSLPQAFKEKLSALGYPAAAISLVLLSFHSHEEIMRKGGYYLYFN